MMEHIGTIRSPYIRGLSMDDKPFRLPSAVFPHLDSLPIHKTMDVAIANYTIALLELSKYERYARPEKNNQDISKFEFHGPDASPSL
jgi:hypothetical protein